MRVNHAVPAISDSALALSTLELGSSQDAAYSAGENDVLCFVARGSGSLAIDGSAFDLAPGSAALVLAGEDVSLAAGDPGLELVVATVGETADRHAPLGPRETVVSREEASSERATGARSFHVLLGPHNGSTRATLFAGFIPPGKAPWHFHLYDEIVWVPEGPGRLHIGDTVTELGAGSAFRLRPRQVHIVENADPDRELTVIGVFTPAGSPSAAYLTPDVAAEYRFTG